MHPEQERYKEVLGRNSVGRDNARAFWAYLCAPEFEVRYRIARDWLHGLNTIAEIGGYRRCIDSYYTSRQKNSMQFHIYSLDYEFESGSTARVTRRRDYFQNYAIPDGPYGLVVLGLDLCGAVEPLVEWIGRAQRCVIEFATEHKPAVKCWQRIEVEQGHRICAKIQLDFERIVMPEGLVGCTKPYLKRTMYLLD